MDALDNMVERIGLDHVAIGTDSTHDQPLEFWHFIVSQQGTKFPSTFADGSVPYTEINFQPKGIDTPAEFPTWPRHSPIAATAPKTSPNCWVETG